MCPYEVHFCCFMQVDLTMHLMECNEKFKSRELFQVSLRNLFFFSSSSNISNQYIQRENFFF